MAYVTVPKDLTKIKSKVMFNLTKRQLICFSAAVAIGLPLFFLTKDSAGTRTAALCMVLAMLPMFQMCIRDSMETLSFSRLAGSISTSGRRSLPTFMPATFMAVLTGMGLSLIHIFRPGTAFCPKCGAPQRDGGAAQTAGQRLSLIHICEHAGRHEREVGPLFDVRDEAEQQDGPGVRQAHDAREVDEMCIRDRYRGKAAARQGCCCRSNRLRI